MNVECPLNWLKSSQRSPMQFVSLTCDTAHASSGFSKRSNENSINTLHAAATDSSWFLGTEKTEQKSFAGWKKHTL